MIGPRIPRPLATAVSGWLSARARHRKAERARGWARHRCPLRAGEPVPRTTPFGPDLWERDRWSPSWPARLLAWWERWTGLSRRRRPVRWPRNLQPPRSCSFCGALHPEDAIAFVRLHGGRGWRVRRSTNTRRWILPYPGTGILRPRPALKVHLQHLTGEEVERFNREVRSVGLAPAVLLGEPSTQGPMRSGRVPRSAAVRV